MPPKAEPGNRIAMEEALSGEELEALHAHCVILLVPFDQWHLSPSLARVWSTVAALRLAERIAAEEQIGEDRALEGAALRLGLSAATIRSRRERA